MFRLIAAAGAFALVATSTQAAELVTNGTFSDGITGFQTGYTGTDATGYLAISTNPNAYCGCFVPIDGTATGHGNQLLVDGAAVGAASYVWQQTIAVVAGTDYTFSFQAANLGERGEIPSLAALLDGVTVIATGDLPYGSFSTGGTYSTYSYSFTAAAPSVTFTILDLTQTHNYNDFALDNVSLQGASPAPEPASWALMVAGFGLLGGALRRRRASVAFA